MSPTPLPASSPLPTRSPSLLRSTVLVIGAIQFALGGALLLAPGRTVSALDLPPAPPWTAWLFGLMAARCVGFGVGMVIAARGLRRHRTWLDVMVLVQTMDWIVTFVYLARGDVGLRNVTTAAFLPVVFVVVLLRGRRHGASA